MKNILATVLLCLLAVNAFAAGAPAAISSTASNQTTTSFVTTGYVFPNGTNTAYWFLTGSTPNGLGGTLGLGTFTTSLSTSNQVTALYTGGLLPGTRYFYALVASNVFGVSTGFTENAITILLNYAWQGPGYCNIDTNHPTSAETVYSLAQAEQQARTGFWNWFGTYFNCDGTFMAGIIPQAAIGTGAIGVGNLGADVLALIASAGSNSTLQVTMTNAMFEVGNYEGSFASAPIGGQGGVLASINVVTNGAPAFRRLRFKADVQVTSTVNGKLISLVATWTPSLGQQVTKYYPSQNLTPSTITIFGASSELFPMSLEVASTNAASGVFAIQIGPGTSPNGLVGVVRSIQVDAIP